MVELRFGPRLQVAFGALAGAGITFLMFALNYLIFPFIPYAADYGGPIAFFDLFILPILVAWAAYRKWKVFAFSVTMVIASLFLIELLFSTYYWVTSLAITARLAA